MSFFLSFIFYVFVWFWKGGNFFEFYDVCSWVHAVTSESVLGVGRGEDWTDKWQHVSVLRL